MRTTRTTQNITKAGRDAVIVTCYTSLQKIASVGDQSTHQFALRICLVGAQIFRPAFNIPIPILRLVFGASGEENCHLQYGVRKGNSAKADNGAVGTVVKERGHLTEVL